MTPAAMSYTAAATPRDQKNPAVCWKLTHYLSPISALGRVLASQRGFVAEDGTKPSGTLLSSWVEEIEDLRPLSRSGFAK